MPQLATKFMMTTSKEYNLRLGDIVSIVDYADFVKVWPSEARVSEDIFRQDHAPFSPFFWRKEAKDVPTSGLWAGKATFYVNDRTSYLRFFDNVACERHF